MQQSEFNISISVESYDEKTAENDRNCYVAKKRIVSKLSMKTRIKIVSNIYVPIFYTFQEICRQRALQSGRVGPGRAG